MHASNHYIIVDRKFVFVTNRRLRFAEDGQAMLSVVFDKVNHIAVLEADGLLSERDLCSAATKVDLMVDKTGKFNGVVVRAKAFPGWDAIAALISHLRSLKDQRQKLPRVALVTASLAAHLAEIFSTHIVNAEIKIFSYHDLEKANRWVTGQN